MTKMETSLTRSYTLHHALQLVSEARENAKTLLNNPQTSNEDYQKLKNIYPRLIDAQIALDEAIKDSN